MNATRIWLAQRVSAALLAIYSIFAPAYLWLDKPAGAQRWHDAFAAWPMRWGTLLFALAAIVHAWTGVHDILLDYVNAPRLRNSLQNLAGMWLAGCAAAITIILWRLA
ncbi:MAG TPA: succinate dehydrogenase, hydrophobic membrane anchor protein [Burkholderiales bacterium]|nr:succinate dehydrogenase, hydrophobic membrane anchor protein [Burkholderiales bacterium]